MTSSWRVLDLSDFEGCISTSRGGIEVAGTRVPLDSVATVLLGDGCSWGYGLVAHAVKYDVAVLVCDWRKVPIAYLSGWSENTRVNARHRAQAELTLPKKKSAWKILVQAKIKNQALVARTLDSPIAGYLNLLAGEVRSGDPANVEAQAAVSYWGNALWEDFCRSQDSSDPANVFLNYGYTILRGCVIREIVAHGLNPTLGVFHRNRSNSFALADDLIEPFRPVVDLLVNKLVTDGYSELSKESRSQLVGVLKQQFSSNGASVSSSVSTLCSNYAQFVERALPKLVCPKWTV